MYGPEALGVDAVQVEISARPQELDLPVRVVALQDVEVERGRHRPFEAQGDEELGVLGVVDAPHRQRSAEDPMRERQHAIDILAHGQVDIEPDKAVEAGAPADVRAPFIPQLGERHRRRRQILPAAKPGAVSFALAWDFAPIAGVNCGVRRKLRAVRDYGNEIFGIVADIIDVPLARHLPYLPITLPSAFRGRP